MITEVSYDFHSSITKPEFSEIPVMVRAYAGEPVPLTAVGMVGVGALRVYGSDRQKVIGFPASDVFKRNDDLLARLRNAYEEGHQVAVADLWAQAESLWAS